MPLDRTRILLAFAICVVLFSAATLLFWGFVRNTILVPVYYVIWVIGLLLNSIPQGAYLALIVLLSAITGWKAIQSTRRTPHIRRVVRNQAAPGTRYRHWNRLCDHAHGGPSSRDWFIAEARKLILSVLAYEHGIDSTQAEALVQDGSLDVPGTLRDMIQKKNIPGAPLPSRLNALSIWLRRLRLREEVPSDPYVEQMIADLVDFLESHLVIPNSDRAVEQPYAPEVEAS